MKLPGPCSFAASLAALPAHAGVQPSCRPSPPERQLRSASGAETTEGKIEGDGTAMCGKLGVHEGGRGTRRYWLCAAPQPNAAPVLVLLRAVFAVICPAAMEFRHEQP